MITVVETVAISTTLATAKHKRLVMGNLAAIRGSNTTPPSPLAADGLRLV